jgi:hypothetical protein
VKVEDWLAHSSIIAQSQTFFTDFPLGKGETVRLERGNLNHVLLIASEAKFECCQIREPLSMNFDIKRNIGVPVSILTDIVQLTRRKTKDAASKVQVEIEHFELVH